MYSAIYRYDDVLLTDVFATDSSQHVKVLKGDDYVTLRFSLINYVEIPAGAYIEFEGVRYYVERGSDVTVRHRREYEYELHLETVATRLKYVLMRNPVDGRTSFPFTGKLQEHVQLLVDVMNLSEPDQSWLMGTNLSTQSQKSIMYDHVTCREALELIANAYDTEWEVEGRTIAVNNVSRYADDPLRLSYGQGNGLRTGVTRKPYGDLPPLRRLYPIGSTRNVSVGTYGAKELHMPAEHGGLVIGYDGQYYSWSSQFLQSKAKYFFISEEGTSLTYCGTSPSLPAAGLTFGQAEQARAYDDIYPHRESTVTGVVRTLDADGNPLYAFSDSTIPSSLDFSSSANLIPGQTLQVTFQSGMLAGRTFDVQYLHNAQSPFAARTFKLIPAELDGITMPNDTYKPATGDKYGVFNMKLPQAYIRDDATHSGAEWNLFKEAAAYLYGNVAEYAYTAEIDPVWLTQHWDTLSEKFNVGTHVLLTDESVQPTPYEVRILRLTQNLNNPKVIRCEFAEQPERPGLLQRRLFTNERAAYRLERNAAIANLSAPSSQDATTLNPALVFSRRDYVSASSFTPTIDNSARYDVLNLLQDITINFKGSSKMPGYLLLVNDTDTDFTASIVIPDGYTLRGEQQMTVAKFSSLELRYLCITFIKQVVIATTQIPSSKTEKEI